MHSPWAGRRVLVTGAGGFIGSHLAGRLAREGADVRAFVRYTSHGGIGGLADEPLASEIEVHHGDLRDPDSVEAAVGGRDAVFHLGALVGIPYSYDAPREVVETNLAGTLNVLLAARRQAVQAVLCASTSEVYGTPARVPIAEGDPLNAQSPYAASKIGADMLALSFHRSYGTRVALARPFNAYGPRQSLRAVVPTILAQALAGGPVKLGSLGPVRDLTYVSDTVAGLMAVGAWPEAPGRIVQLGSGEGVSVRELVRLAGEIVGRELEVVVDPARVRPEESEVERLVCDPSLALRELGWRAEVPLVDGLALTADWIEANPRAYPVDAYAV